MSYQNKKRDIDEKERKEFQEKQKENGKTVFKGEFQEKIDKQNDFKKGYHEKMDNYNKEIKEKGIVGNESLKSKDNFIISAKIEVLKKQLARLMKGKKEMSDFASNEEIESIKKQLKFYNKLQGNKDFITKPIPKERPKDWFVIKKTEKQIEEEEQAKADEEARLSKEAERLKKFDEQRHKSKTNKKGAKDINYYLEKIKEQEERTRDMQIIIEQRRADTERMQQMYQNMQNDQNQQKVDYYQDNQQQNNEYDMQYENDANYNDIQNNQREQKNKQNIPANNRLNRQNKQQRENVFFSKGRKNVYKDLLPQVQEELSFKGRDNRLIKGRHKKHITEYMRQYIAFSNQQNYQEKPAGNYVVQNNKPHRRYIEKNHIDNVKGLIEWDNSDQKIKQTPLKPQYRNENRMYYKDQSFKQQSGYTNNNKVVQPKYVNQNVGFRSKDRFTTEYRRQFNGKNVNQENHQTRTYITRPKYDIRKSQYNSSGVAAALGCSSNDEENFSQSFYGDNGRRIYRRDYTIYQYEPKEKTLNMSCDNNLFVSRGYYNTYPANSYY